MSVYLDGPHCAFTIDRHYGPGFVFIGDGVGITQLMSKLRTMADRRDPRPCYLFFGNREWESIAGTSLYRPGALGRALVESAVESIPMKTHNLA